MKWLFFFIKFSLRTPCYHRKNISIALPINISSNRMASGLMEIWKARNSINLLLIDLISFLRPPIDAPKKFLSSSSPAVDRRQGPQLMARELMEWDVLCFCFSLSFFEKNWNSLTFLKTSEWNFLIGFIVMSTTMFFYSFVKLTHKHSSQIFSVERRRSKSSAFRW